MMPHRGARVDANQAEICAALRNAGASVITIGLPVDLLIGFRNQTMLMEVKNPKSNYGKAGANANQAAFMKCWRGGAVAMVDSPEAALRAIGMMV